MKIGITISATIEIIINDLIEHLAKVATTATIRIATRLNHENEVG